jgi:deoxyribose-phosphate aldolase
MNVSAAASNPSRAALAATIDHTLLDPAADGVAIDRVCDEALVHGFAAVCVAPVWIGRVARRVGERGVQPCSVIGFPTGAHRTETKVEEARRAIGEGARELDVVIALWALKSGDLAAVARDLEAVVAAAGAGTTVKAILETCRLASDEKRVAARLAVEAGVAFVKTSTGFAGGGATVEDVRLLRAVVGAGCGVKASGGLRTTAQALELLGAGASRLGTSVGPALLDGLPGLGA